MWGVHLFDRRDDQKRSEKRVWDLVGRRECNAREEKRASYITYVGVRKMSKGESEGSHI